MVGIAACAVVACADAEAELACATSSLVYERDDRREPYELGSIWSSIGAAQIVALVDANLAGHLTSGALDAASLRADRLLQLCADEPFAAQPAIASCSGVAVRADLILTAGHCVRSMDECQSLLIARGFQNELDDQWVEFEASDLQRCASLIWTAGDELAGTGSDVALLRIEPPLPDFVRAPLVAKPPVVGTPLFALSYPLGLPLKLDAGAQVRGYLDGMMRADLDAYGGSSGGAVFDAAGHLLGLLIGGKPDFVFDAAAQCKRSAAHAARGCAPASFERVAPIWQALTLMCSEGIDEACVVLGSADEELTQG